MADTTEEEVRRCPRCEQPGTMTANRPIKGKPGAKLQNFMCMNKRCRWYNTEWTVQINPDGTVPPPQRHKKFFDKPDAALAAQVQANAEAILQRSREQGEIAARERY